MVSNILTLYFLLWLWTADIKYNSRNSVHFEKKRKRLIRLRKFSIWSASDGKANILLWVSLGLNGFVFCVHRTLISHRVCNLFGKLATKHLIESCSTIKIWHSAIKLNQQIFSEPSSDGKLEAHDAFIIRVSFLNCIHENIFKCFIKMSAKCEIQNNVGW